MKNSKTYQAPDSDTADSAADDKRKKVSKRSYIDAQGNEVDRIEEATGARYTLLVPSGNIDFDEQIGPAGKLSTMCGIMGFVTKVGNVANSVLNNKDDEGTPEDAAEAIKEWLKIMRSPEPQWAERATGAPGTRVDKDALAGAFVAVVEQGNGANWTAAVTANGDADSARAAIYSKVRDRLETDPAYVKAIRAADGVAKEYATRIGKAAKSADDLL